MSDSNEAAKQATPHALLLAELLDSRIPKSEREHAAKREIERLTAERDDLRAALIAAMEIVQEDRAGFALANTWQDGSMEAGDDAILRRYDAVIAQADAAMGLTRPAEE